MDRMINVVYSVDFSGCIINLIFNLSYILQKVLLNMKVECKQKCPIRTDFPFWSNECVADLLFVSVDT